MTGRFLPILDSVPRIAGREASSTCLKGVPNPIDGMRVVVAKAAAKAAAAEEEPKLVTAAQKGVKPQEAGLREFG